jgi:lipid A 3-O-deacylase
MACRCYGQAIGDLFFYSNSPEPNHLRLTYDNDFFTATDRYYTQGIQLTIANTSLKHNPVNYLLLKSRSASVHGISIEHNAYTPTSITWPYILYGDQPYTATLMLSSFSVNTDENKKQKWTSSLSLGVLGPSASGQWMQKSIHKWLDNVQPEGWKYQLKDAPIINYTLTHQRNILEVANYFSASATGSVSLGTLLTKADAGIYLMAGYFKGPYATAHIYAYPSASFVAYDATLQGGLFTKNNIYSLQTGSIERLVFRGRAGIAFNYAGLSLEHFYGFNTKTFTGQKNVLWGGISLGVAF